MWTWLIKPQIPYTWGFIFRVILKACVLFGLINILFIVLQPMDAIGRLSIYNLLVRGRERLPYGANPSEAYTLTMNSLPAMFATHEINRPKAHDEFRVVLVGDSATWGFLLASDETLARQVTDMHYQLPDGRRVVAYNIGHPVLSVTKDLLLLDEAMAYQPDMVVWLVTLQSFAKDRQLGAPIVQNNPSRVRHLITHYGLAINPDDPQLQSVTLWDMTLIGQRRALADWLRIQLYGVMWQTTGIDHRAPYTPRTNDFDADLTWEHYTVPIPFEAQDLAFDVIHAGHVRVGDMPLIVVNEPIFIATGRNSDLRYNSFYPRWAYDSYRNLLAELAQTHEWQYCDLWDVMPADSFTDSPLHMTAEATQALSQILAKMMVNVMIEGTLGKECERDG